MSEAGERCPRADWGHWVTRQSLFSSLPYHALQARTSPYIFLSVPAHSCRSSLFHVYGQTGSFARNAHDVRCGGELEKERSEGETYDMLEFNLTRTVPPVGVDQTCQTRVRGSWRSGSYCWCWGISSQSDELIGAFCSSSKPIPPRLFSLSCSHQSIGGSVRGQLIALI